MYLYVPLILKKSVLQFLDRTVYEKECCWKTQQLFFGIVKVVFSV
jgi:hypothetical protein